MSTGFLELPQGGITESIFGQIGVEALLNDQKVVPLKLQNTKFQWIVRTPLESLNSVL